MILIEHDSGHKITSLKLHVVNKVHDNFGGKEKNIFDAIIAVWIYRDRYGFEKLNFNYPNNIRKKLFQYMTKS